MLVWMRNDPRRPGRRIVKRSAGVVGAGREGAAQGRGSGAGLVKLKSSAPRRDGTRVGIRLGPGQEAGTSLFIRAILSEK
jgi:hypothetical protein